MTASKDREKPCWSRGSQARFQPKWPVAVLSQQQQTDADGFKIAANDQVPGTGPGYL